MEKKYISIPEVYNILSKKEQLTDMEKENLEYAGKFSRVDPSVIDRVKGDISGIAKLPEKVIVKILDLKPGTPADITSILSTYNVMISDEDLNALADYLKKLKF
ncbi:hypothetical protein [Thermoplasma volcanium GSS1]|uniref:DNA-directed RNA polymerase subunit Rpo4 n=1 Tax=Thermoplasma volcanium (strain ATCC 51530 / DSM 4299 / JCM 9571 / NBRC 15438 / GSS1) TaxID=273116 RepID=Q97BZ0_THEVO|nr:hypothetical protein [Thermoplasma volcanium]BAB59457.1 hypothetical protein [Thermoplasma volcanium GSS1]